MRKGIDGLAMLVQAVLHQDPFAGHLFVFRGRKANLIKIVYWDGPVCGQPRGTPLTIVNSSVWLAHEGQHPKAFKVRVGAQLNDVIGRLLRSGIK